MHPCRGADRAICHHNIIMADNKVDRQSGKGTEQTTIQLGEFIHDPFKAFVHTNL